MIEFVYTSILLGTATFITLLVFGIKKFIERVGEIMAEKLLQNRKEN